MRFNEIPSAGIFKDKPQVPFEAYEELERIKELLHTIYLNESEETYGCIDMRESSK